MFLTNLKSSLWVLPWLLLGLVVYAVPFAMYADPWIQRDGTSMVNVVDGCKQLKCTNTNMGGLSFGVNSTGCSCGLDWFCDCDPQDPCLRFNWEWSKECFGISTGAAIIFNIVLLLIIPCALGAYDAGKKRLQFYLGFFINLAALIAFPVTWFLVYQLDHTTFIIMLLLHLLSFMGTYITGSRFVSPAYKKSFWFV